MICNFTLLGLRGCRAWHWLVGAAVVVPAPDSPQPGRGLPRPVGLAGLALAGLRAGGGPVAGLLCRVAAPAPRPGALALGAVSVSL
mgnify:CR=1 FL=1